MFPAFLEEMIMSASPFLVFPRLGITCYEFSRIHGASSLPIATNRYNEAFTINQDNFLGDNINNFLNILLAHPKKDPSIVRYMSQINY